MPVGFEGFDRNRRVIRSPVNPLDKSTIVSIFPMDIKERKVTLEPGYFHIKAGKVDSPSILVVGPSSWWRDIDPEQPLLEITQSSIIVAESVIRDWANALFMCDMAESMPGIFYIPGEKDIIEIKHKYKGELEKAYKKQHQWYANLVEAADILWARSNGNPIAISGDMRLAAQELGLKERAWMANTVAASMIECKACGFMVKPGFPICANCKTIVNDVLYQELGLKQAV